MPKTITIIELLNKIANGEEVPEKIEWDKEEFFYDKKSKDYLNASRCSLLYEMTSGHVGTDILYNKVEVIEEKQDIETLNPEEVYFKDGTELVYKLMYDKLNEVAMKVNKMNRDINKLKEK